MLTSSLLLLSIASVVLSTGGRTAQDCTIGEEWTDKFIRFECYEGTGVVVKGVRAIGCVPSNTASGSVIKPGTTFDEQYFTYSCSKSGDAVAYQIINCRDSTGKVLPVGEAREMEDGSAWKCYKDQSGAIKLSQEKQGGCLYEGKVYTVGQTWNHNVEFKATVAGVSQTIGKAIRMECKKAGAEGFVGQPIRCVTSTGTNLSNGDFAMVNSVYVKCKIAVNGAVTMTAVDEGDVTCSFNGVTLKNGERYTTPDGVDVYKCVYGIMKKSGCIVDGKTYGTNELVYVSGKAYHCNGGAGLVDFGDIKGCTLPDGSLKPFLTTWINGTEVHRCQVSIRGSKVTPYVAFWGCAFKKRAIGRNKIVVDGEELKKCALVGKQYGMRQLTGAEYTAYTESQKGSLNVIGGAGGSGSGDDIIAEPTTAMPEQPTTEPRAAATTQGTTEPALTSTTRAPTTTTIAERLTKPKDTTATPVATEPASTTTTAVEKTTTMKKVEVFTPTSIPSTPSSATESTVTVGSTTVAPGSCHDHFEMCSSLAPICLNRKQLAVANLKEIIKTTNITVEQIKQLLSLVGDDGQVPSSEEEREEMDEVVRGLAGFESDEDKDCVCRDDSCASRCQKRRRPSCKKCQIFKKKVREMVLIVCPSTCGSCDAVGRVPAIIKALVRFYTHDCR